MSFVVCLYIVNDACNIHVFQRLIASWSCFGWCHQLLLMDTHRRRFVLVELSRSTGSGRREHSWPGPPCWRSPRVVRTSYRYSSCWRWGHWPPSWCGGGCSRGSRTPAPGSLIKKTYVTINVRNNFMGTTSNSQRKCYVSRFKL